MLLKHVANNVFVHFSNASNYIHMDQPPDLSGPLRRTEKAFPEWPQRPGSHPSLALRWMPRRVCQAAVLAHAAWGSVAERVICSKDQHKRESVESAPNGSCFSNNNTNEVIWKIQK